MAIATMSEACKEYVAWVGAYRPTSEWILTDYDSWEPNPHYVGPPTNSHPETECMPECLVYLEYKDAANAAKNTAPALGVAVRLEHYKDRCWVVWLK